MTQSYNDIAARLRSAYTHGAVAPLRDLLEPTDAAGAYMVQAINTRFWENQGRRVVGRKIGLTAKAVQAQLGVSQPDYGVLFSDMQISSGGLLKTNQVIQPKAEAEIALVLGRDLDIECCTTADVIAAVDYVLPAIEIVDSRIADWKITFADTVADNGSSAFFVLGNQPLSIKGLDLLTCGMVMTQNGNVCSVGAGAACLGHPLLAAAWLADTMVRAGNPLRAGEVLLTGALGPMVTISPGDHIEAQIGGIGSVNFRFE